MATQLDVINRQATMAGFVQAYVDETHRVVTHPPSMDFLIPAVLPVSDFLATEYLVCNRWFASLPADTQPNRSMAFTGTTLIDGNVTGLIPHRPLLFKWLDEHDVRWRVYHSGLSFFLLFGEFDFVLDRRFRSVRKLAQDFQSETPGRAPQVVIVEPEYEDSPVHLGYTPNDNHPPLGTGPGEAFLHMVYSALTANPKRWAKTLLLVLYDEHGGFYDHVPPLPMQLAPPRGARFSAPFATTGVRVPAFVVSPQVPRGGVSNALFDHTSILQLLAEKFAGDPRAFSDEVNKRRDQGIASLSAALTPAAMRRDLPLAPAGPISINSVFRGGVKQPFTNNQKAFALAARECLKCKRRQTLAHFPELAMLSPESV